MSPGLLQFTAHSVSDSLIPKVQLVQNAAARLITGAEQCDHIMPMLCQLHWLPIQRRVEYKVTCFDHQSLSGQAPVCTWRMTSTSLPTVVAVCSDQLPPGHASSHEHKTVSATEASVLPAHVYGDLYCVFIMTEACKSNCIF